MYNLGSTIMTDLRRMILPVGAVRRQVQLALGGYKSSDPSDKNGLAMVPDEAVQSPPHRVDT